jgi:two-component system CheB/CheR fusion protein
MHKLREPLLAMGQAEGQVEDFQLEHVVENGEFRVLLAKSRLVPSDGNRALLLTVEDITARKKAELLTLKEKERLEGKVQITEQALGRTQEELRALAASLFTAQEEERRRVARELHDDLSQKMAMLEVDVQRLEQQLPDGALHEQMAQLRERTGGLSNDLRRIAHQLHPGILDDLGLGFALKALAEEFAERQEIPVRYTSNSLPENIPSGIASCIYRVTQEALRNVAKHAGHTPVRITLNGTNEGLRLVIRDMGNGFDTRAARQQGGLGIISMQERVRLVGGRISIRSSPGNGTTINVRVPLGAEGMES